MDNNNHSGAIQAQAIRAGYGQHIILEQIDLQVLHGGITALVGPNGSGKSTLLKVCTKLLAPEGGSVLLNGENISRLSTREMAKRLAILPQGPVAPANLTVRDLVEQGRYAQVGPFRMLRRQDHEAITRAIDLVRLNDFADRDVDTLSGGERQRAWLALALAQDTAILALDEPTTFLDIGHQLEVLELVQELNREQGMTVLMVLHDLNHAASFADQMVVLNRGQIVGTGQPWETLQPQLLQEVFGVDASIISDPHTDKPLIVAHRSALRTGTVEAMKPANV
ncbi:MAG: ABC transporter ATP-binding protein [Chloroflexales bacterium]|nr:ABC transporter ATP-binding protein [Chloroflexales bacterium]